MLALCDGLVYAQLGAALPGSGGPYVYLREAYKPFGLGPLMAFLFIFQIMLVAPLSIASGAVGFADYLGFYWTAMGAAARTTWSPPRCAAAMTALLYRNIRDIGRLARGHARRRLAHGRLGHRRRRCATSRRAGVRLSAGGLHARRRTCCAAIGAVALLAMYNYGGYNNVCNIARRDPRSATDVPRAIVLSILLVVALYIVMSTVIIGVIPWTEAQQTRTIASVFIERTFADPAAGRAAAVAMTALDPLRDRFVALRASSSAIRASRSRRRARASSSACSRASTRPKHFPHVSLVTIGAMAIPFCFFTLGQIVNWLILVQIVSQFIWQCAGVILLRRYRQDVPQPFRMWLYPIPAIVALILWAYVFVSAPASGMLFALGFVAAGVIAYFIFSAVSARRPQSAAS